MENRFISEGFHKVTLFIGILLKSYQTLKVCFGVVFSSGCRLVSFLLERQRLYATDLLLKSL